MWELEGKKVCVVCVWPALYSIACCCFPVRGLGAAGETMCLHCLGWVIPKICRYLPALRRKGGPLWKVCLCSDHSPNVPLQRCVFGEPLDVCRCVQLLKSTPACLQLIVISHFQSLPFQKACQVGLSLSWEIIRCISSCQTPARFLSISQWREMILE